MGLPRFWGLLFFPPSASRYFWREILLLLRCFIWWLKAFHLYQQVISQMQVFLSFASLFSEKIVFFLISHFFLGDYHGHFLRKPVNTGFCFRAVGTAVVIHTRRRLVFGRAWWPFCCFFKSLGYNEGLDQAWLCVSLFFCDVHVWNKSWTYDFLIYISNTLLCPPIRPLPTECHLTLWTLNILEDWSHSQQWNVFLVAWCVKRIFRCLPLNTSEYLHCICLFDSEPAQCRWNFKFTLDQVILEQSYIITQSFQLLYTAVLNV